MTPDDPQVLYLLGSVHLAQRRYAQASDLLEKAVARTGSAEMTRSLGFSQLGLGRGDLGVASLEKAFAANPGDVRAGMTLTTIYLRRGQAPKALQTAEAMAKRDPANLAVLNFLGSVKGSTGDRAGARAAYTAGAGQGPGVPSRRREPRPPRYRRRQVTTTRASG